MPDLVRLYIRSAVFGVVLGLAFTACLLWLDVGGLRHLLMASWAGYIGMFMLAFFHAALFSGVQFGIAVMLMEQREGGTPPRLRQPVTNLAPILQTSPVRPDDAASDRALPLMR